MQISGENSISNSNVPNHPRLTAVNCGQFGPLDPPPSVPKLILKNAKQPITSSENTLACISKSKNYFIILTALLRYHTILVYI